jgi:hypothetical protein
MTGLNLQSTAAQVITELTLSSVHPATEATNQQLIASKELTPPASSSKSRSHGPLHRLSGDEAVGMSAVAVLWHLSGVTSKVGSAAQLPYSNHLKLSNHLFSCSRWLEKLSAFQLVEVTVAIAKLKLKPADLWADDLLAALHKGMDSLAPASIVSCLSALASLSLRPQQQWVDAAGKQLLLPPRGSSVASPDGMLSWLLSAEEHVALTCALANLCTSPKPPFLYSLEVLAGPLLSTIPLEALAQLLSSYNRLGHQPAKSWLRAFACAALPQLQAAPPMALVQLLSAVANLRERGAASCLGHELWDGLWSSTAARMADGRILIGAFSSLLQAAGVLRSKQDLSPPCEWLEACAEHAARLLPAMGAYHLSKLLHAMARLRMAPLPPATISTLTLSLTRLLPKFSPHQLACATASLEHLKLPPDQELALALCLRTEALAPTLAPEELSHALHGMACMEARPSPKLQLALLGATYAGMHATNTQDICSMTASLARMGCKPDPIWLER